MAKEDKLTVFAIGNGDSILIEARGKRILTDINLKSDPADNLPDLEEELRDACGHGAPLRADASRPGSSPRVC